MKRLCRCQADLTKRGRCEQCDRLPADCACLVLIDRDPRNADWLKPSKDLELGRFRTVVQVDQSGQA